MQIRSLYWENMTLTSTCGYSRVNISFIFFSFANACDTYVQYESEKLKHVKRILPKTLLNITCSFYDKAFQYTI